MFTQQLLQGKKFVNLIPNYVFKRNSQQSATKELYNLQTVLHPLKEKRPAKEALLRNTLLGQFDNDFLEPLELENHARFKEFSNWLKPIEHYILSCTDAGKKLNDQEVLSHLRELEVFRTGITEENNGLYLSETESLKLVETLSTVPWVATYFVKSHIKPLEIISKYGSLNQKLEYIPKIMSGELIPTVCIHEDDNGTNINNIKSLAFKNKESSTLNGKKTFVVNGINSNLFLVFAKHNGQMITESPAFSLFLVERDDHSVVCTDVYKTVGRHQIPMCTVNFTNVEVPDENVIGVPGSALNILMESLKPGRQNIDAQAISILRNFMSQLISDVLEAKHLDRPLYDFDAVKRVIGDMTNSLYTMESMAYFTSGLADRYENQDLEIEKIITEMYCANECLKHIQAGLQLMGAQSFTKRDSYIHAFHEAISLLTLDMNNTDAFIYTAVTALKHCGKSINEYIHKKRNKHMYPMFTLKDLYFQSKKGDLKIGGALHPSLTYGGNFLEQSIDLLRQCVSDLFCMYGAELVDRHIELYRLTEIMTHIYAIIANLSRANRSYCCGVENSDKERQIAVLLACTAKTKISQIVEDTKQGPQVNGDYIRHTMCNLTYEKHKYPLSHPLTRTY